MAYSWFHHTDCTTEQASMLVARYRARGFETERSLNGDFITWTVSVRLPECNHPPRTPRSFIQQIWD